MPCPRNVDEGPRRRRATRTFWVNSYEATATEDLCVAAGLGRSIYNPFDSKHELFRRAQPHYLATMNANQLGILEGEEHSPVERLCALFAAMIDGETDTRRAAAAVDVRGVGLAALQDAVDSSRTPPVHRADERGVGWIFVGAEAMVVLDAEGVVLAARPRSSLLGERNSQILRRLVEIAAQFRPTRRPAERRDGTPPGRGRSALAIAGLTGAALVLPAAAGSAGRISAEPVDLGAPAMWTDASAGFVDGPVGIVVAVIAVAVGAWAVLRYLKRQNAPPAERLAGGLRATAPSRLSAAAAALARWGPDEPGIVALSAFARIAESPSDFTDRTLIPMWRGSTDRVDARRTNAHLWSALLQRWVLRDDDEDALPGLPIRYEALRTPDELPTDAAAEYASQHRRHLALDPVPKGLDPAADRSVHRASVMAYRALGRSRAEVLHRPVELAAGVAPPRDGGSDPAATEPDRRPTPLHALQGSPETGAGPPITRRIDRRSRSPRPRPGPATATQPHPAHPTALTQLPGTGLRDSGNGQRGSVPPAFSWRVADGHLPMCIVIRVVIDSAWAHDREFWRRGGDGCVAGGVPLVREWIRCGREQNPDVRATCTWSAGRSCTSATGHAWLGVALFVHCSVIVCVGLSVGVDRSVHSHPPWWPPCSSSGEPPCCGSSSTPVSEPARSPRRGIRTRWRAT